MKKTYEQLCKIREEYAEKLKIRAGVANNDEKHILICGGTGCTSSGSHKIVEALTAELKANGIEDRVKIVQTGCFGLCALGPIMIVYPEGTFYSRTEAEQPLLLSGGDIPRQNFSRVLVYCVTSLFSILVAVSVTLVLFVFFSVTVRT